MSISDFEFLKFVGEGAYGKIYLVRKKKTGDTYAMKIVDFADRVIFFVLYLIIIRKPLITRLRALELKEMHINPFQAIGL